MRDILEGDDSQVIATIEVIRRIDPDILVLTQIDWDHNGAALNALNAAGLDYPFVFTARPNSGRDSGFDLDANGRLGEARDAVGYGRFSGEGGMAVLSRWPIETDVMTDLTNELWRDVEGATLPVTSTGAPFPNAEVWDVLPASSTNHWVLPISTPGGPVTLLAWSATPPVFDGAEDFNGLRNLAELRIWEPYMTGDFILIGNANLDPVDGDGKTEAMQVLLGDTRIIDPMPQSMGGVLAADPDQLGDPALDTADWPDGAPGNLRVSYVLPSRSLEVLDAGVFWPAPDEPDAGLLGGDGLAAGPHRIVWVDISR